MVLPWSDARPIEMRRGLVRRTLATGDRIMMAEFRAQPGVSIPVHAHPHEQVGYVVSGQMVHLVEGEETVVGPGDSYAIAPGVRHGARFEVEAVVLESFSPPRDDYR